MPLQAFLDLFYESLSYRFCAQNGYNSGNEEFALYKGVAQEAFWQEFGRSGC